MQTKYQFKISGYLITNFKNNYIIDTNIYWYFKKIYAHCYFLTKKSSVFKNSIMN